MVNGLQMKYFVLTPLKDDPYGEASRDAIYTYASSIQFENEELASDLFAWLDEIENDKTFS